MVAIRTNNEQNGKPLNLVGGITSGFFLLYRTLWGEDRPPLLKLETLEDLQLLHTNLVPESNTLEYKASPAVENTDARKLEMSKNISAMANAEGGQFVYAMTEANHLPAGLDGGIQPAPFNGLWFEQVILQNIHQS